MRAVAFTPYGRERTVSVLLPYLRRDYERGLIAEWQLWLNTDDDQAGDVEYAHTLARTYRWIVLKERPTRHRLHPKQLNTGAFYRYCTDPDTVYLRFDDDIVYVHEDAIPRLVEAKTARKDVLGVFPIIWNNAICSWHLQQRGLIPYGYGRVRAPYCMDPIGWADGRFAVRIHELLLSKIEAGAVDDLYLYQDVQLQPQQQFSVSCFAVHSDDYRALKPPGVLDCAEEEHWLTVHRPGVVGKSNTILANALVSHYTFYPQREHVGRSNVLDRYRALAEKVG